MPVFYLSELGNSFNVRVFDQNVNENDEKNIERNHPILKKYQGCNTHGIMLVLLKEIKIKPDDVKDFQFYHARCSKVEGHGFINGAAVYSGPN